MPRKVTRAKRIKSGSRKSPHQRVGSAMKGIMKGRPWKGVKREG